MYVSVGNIFFYIAYILMVTNEKSVVIAMVYRQDCPGFEPRQEKNIFSCRLQNRPTGSWCPQQSRLVVADVRDNLSV
jgi:hypothetical protein